MASLVPSAAVLAFIAFDVLARPALARRGVTLKTLWRAVTARLFRL